MQSIHQKNSTFLQWDSRNRKVSVKTASIYCQESKKRLLSKKDKKSKVVAMPTEQLSSNLSRAKNAKDDEFYTQLPDIERELKHYKDHFKDKVVYCNCDDPRFSNFFHYFSYRFEDLDLKKLIAACYKSQDRDFFSKEDSDTAIYLEYYGTKKGGRVPDVEDIGVKHLKGDGDFRNDEMIELLKGVDIVVTNPPFSLFREYVAQLMKYDKKFLIVGPQNAITYKDVFNFIKENKLWVGYGFKSGNAYFQIPHAKEFAKGVYDEKTGLVKFRNVAWYTNLDISKRHEDLDLYKSYTPEEYPKYDNYDAINVNKVANIPMDYDGVMGVPITFMNDYNPEQFEILGLSQKVGYGLKSNKFYDDYKETRQDGTKTGSSGKKTNGNPVMKGRPERGNFYTNGTEIVHSLYGRIFIRNKRL